jgi:hypothetical protein
LKRSPTGKAYESHIKYSQSGNPLTKFVNLCQSKEERRDKYAFCRFYGIGYRQSTVMRDWHWPKICVFLEAFTQGETQLHTFKANPNARDYYLLAPTEALGPPPAT